MNLPKFVQTTALVVTWLVAVLLSAVLLAISGRPVLYVVRAVLFFAAMFGYGITFYMLFGNLRGARPFNGWAVLKSTVSATMFLVSAWLLTLTLL